MKVFLSWSGAKSSELAVALRDWLPQVINALDPFVSSKDITAGSQWQAEIAARLETTYFGIVCVTKENQREPWLNFEAGALAKAIEASKVVPLAIDLKPSDIELPLAQFQAQPATKEGIAEIVIALNAACEAPLQTARLEKALEMWWPELAARLTEITKKAAEAEEAPRAKGRSERDLMEETLDTVRTIARKMPGQVAVEFSAALGADHPLLAELRAIASAFEDGDDVIILPSTFPSTSARTVGVRASATLRRQAREAMAAAAKSYGADVVFLAPRRPNGLRTAP